MSAWFVSARLSACLHCEPDAGMHHRCRLSLHRVSAWRLFASHLSPINGPIIAVCREWLSTGRRKENKGVWYDSCSALIPLWQGHPEIPRNSSTCSIAHHNTFIQNTQTQRSMLQFTNMKEALLFWKVSLSTARPELTTNKRFRQEVLHSNDELLPFYLVSRHSGGSTRFCPTLTLCHSSTLRLFYFFFFYSIFSN